MEQETGVRNRAAERWEWRAVRPFKWEPVLALVMSEVLYICLVALIVEQDICSELISHFFLLVLIETGRPQSLIYL